MVSFQIAGLTQSNIYKILVPLLFLYYDQLSPYKTA